MLILFNCLLSVKIIITQKHFSVNGRAAKYRKINFADNINLCFYVLRTNFVDTSGFQQVKLSSARPVEVLAEQYHQCVLVRLKNFCRTKLNSREKFIKALAFFIKILYNKFIYYRENFPGMERFPAKGMFTVCQDSFPQRIC